MPLTYNLRNLLISMAQKSHNKSKTKQSIQWLIHKHELSIARENTNMNMVNKAQHTIEKFKLILTKAYSLFSLKILAHA